MRIFFFGEEFDIFVPGPRTADFVVGFPPPPINGQVTCKGNAMSNLRVVAHNSGFGALSDQKKVGRRLANYLVIIII